jgi:hypothetical protein
MSSPTVAVFEPWSMGDALIAASVLATSGRPAALVCHPRWHAVLGEWMRGEGVSLELLLVELAYTTRQRRNPFDLTDALARAQADQRFAAIREVFSARGDLRDAWAARRLFPGARLRLSGWEPFFCRKSAWLDRAFHAGRALITNRYVLWGHALGVSTEALDAAYHARRERATPEREAGTVAIHLGAQWRSKQYPYVAELRDELRRRGREVQLLAGPGDPLPEGITQSEVLRAVDLELIAQLRRAGDVITNDSGPLHLAALLGCEVTAVGNPSNLREWLPPGARCLPGSLMPQGYRPDPRYSSDSVLEGWPAAATVADVALSVETQ